MKIDPVALGRIRDLAQAKAPSGFEDETVAVARKCFSDAFSLKEDSLRNLYIRRRSDTGDKPVVMLDAHSDEVGFMVHSVKPNGVLRFVELGGWSLNTLPGTRVLVRNAAGEWIRGMIAAKPPHFLTAEEKAANHIQPLQSLVIDIGATSDRDAVERFGIRIGEPVVPDTPFCYDEARDVMTGKGFDCRIGCAALIETMLRSAQADLAVDVVGVLSAQEEVGERGCKVAINNVKPDIGIVFEGCPADDTFGESYAMQTKLRCGPMMRFMDVSVICNPRFQRFTLDLAAARAIPAQASVREGGGNNAAMIQSQLTGAPSIVVGIPVRYIHSPCGLAAYADYEAAVELVLALLKELNQETIASF